MLKRRFLASGPPFENLEYLAVGKSSIVHGIDEWRVLKEYTDPNGNEHIIERQVYEHLGLHKTIARFYGSLEDGAIIVERGQVLRKFLQLTGADQIPLHRKIRWSKQIAQGLRHMHQREIVHADIGCHNVILVKADLKIIDFEGCSIDGGPADSCYEWFSYRRSTPQVSKQTDIFAFGCMMYEIITGNFPHQELEKEGQERTRLTEERYERNEFPDVTNLPLGHLMQACWHGNVLSMEEVLKSLNAATGPSWKAKLWIPLRTLRRYHPVSGCPSVHLSENSHAPKTYRKTESETTTTSR